MTGSKTILCSTRNSDRIRLSKIILGNRTDPFRQVFKLKGGHLKLWWEVLAIGNIPKRSPLEWRGNDHLFNIYIRIRVETDVSNKWYRKKFGRSVDSQKSRQYFERNYFLRSVSSRFWANCFPYRSFMPLSSGLLCITGVISRVFRSGGQMHEACANGESLAQKITE